MSWWASKVRQTARHLAGRVHPDERTELAAWLTSRQRQLFDAMHPADQRHGLDVTARLRAEGHDDSDLLLAGLLHDCAKGRDVRLVHRIAWSLAEHYGEGVLSVARWVPGSRVAFERLRVHAEASAQLALEAGCSDRAAELIRHQADPLDPVAGRALHLADEAS